MGNADIEIGHLCDELISLDKFVKFLENPTTVDILNFIKKSKLEDLNPKICRFEKASNCDHWRVLLFQIESN